MFNEWEPTVHDGYCFGSPLLSGNSRITIARGRTYDPNQPPSANNYPGMDGGDGGGKTNLTGPKGDPEYNKWRFTASHSSLPSKEEYFKMWPDATEDDWYRLQVIRENYLTGKQEGDESELTDTYWQDMQNFVESQPGYQAMSEFMPQHIQRINELEQGQMDPYTGQLTVQDPWQRNAMLGQLGGEYFGGLNEKYDEFGGMFKSTKEALLPQMDKNFKEQVSDPMAERLEMLGLSGASPGMEMTAGVNQDFAIDRAMAGAQAENVYAGQMMGVEQARQGAMGQTGAQMQGLMGMGEATQRTNQGLQYQDWLTHQNDQYQRLGMGAAAMNTSAGALSSAAGQSINAAEIPFSQASSWDMAQADQAFMAPYMEMMNQPISSGGGKK